MNDDRTFDQSTEDPVAADRLRRTLAAVATEVPTEDRTAELLAVLPTAPSGEPAPAATDEPSVISLTDLRGPRATRRWLAAAAAVVVAGLGAAALLSSDEPREQVEAEPGGAGTGWYLPDTGWELTSVQGDFLDVDCPCSYWMAARPGTDPSVIDVVERRADDPAGDLLPAPEAIDVDGRPGQVGSLVEGGDDTLVVASGGRQLVVQSRDVERDALVAVADAWLDRLDAGQPVDAGDLPLPEGMEGGAITHVPARASEHLLAIRFREAATGREVELQLVPTGHNRSLAQFATSVELVDGRFRFSGNGGTMPGSGTTIALAGFVGGAVDVLAGDSFFGDEIEPLPADDLAEFVDGLREVSTEEWRAALAGAEGDVIPEALEAPSLFEAPLVDG